MTTDDSLLPGRLLRRPGEPKPVASFRGVQIDDRRLVEVLSPDAKLLCLYDGTLHGEGPIWQPARNRLVWSDVPNRRLLAWQPDGQVKVAIDATFFMNGNALDAKGRLVHCEHGRRCISRSTDDVHVDPIVTHYEGKRLNSPNDITVASDGAIWFTDPMFGILMPNQGSLAEPELEHRSVYRLDPRTNELCRMADFEQPNGLFFSPDGRTLYVSDTARSLNEIPPGNYHGSTHEIIAFDVGEDASLSNRRSFYRTDHGYPDGVAVDSRGWVWTTAADGVHVLAPDGTRLGYIPTPTICSNCAFGGPGMTRLYRDKPSVGDRYRGRQPMSEHYDIIVIGSGPGGGSLAHRLAPTGRRILMLERGEYLPRSRENWDAKTVFVDGKYLHHRRELLSVDRCGQPDLDHPRQRAPRRRSHQVAPCRLTRGAKR